MTRLLVLADALTATTTSAQMLPYNAPTAYGAPSLSSGAPLPDATNDVGFRNYRFDNSERGSLTSFQRRALKRAAEAARMTAKPAAPPQAL